MDIGKEVMTRQSRRPRLFLGFDSLDATNSGIARVARLIARTISEFVVAGELEAEGIVLEGMAQPPSGSAIPFRSANGSRFAFVKAITSAIRTYDAFLYDGPGMARAHGWMPYPRRPFLTWIHGIESWPGSAHLKQVAAAKRATELVAISAFSRGRAIELEPTAARATVCWLATETDDPPIRERNNSGPPRVTILSRVDADSYKGHFELIRCWPKVRERVSNAVLTIAGSGPGLVQLKRLAAEMQFDPSAIEFRGFIAESALDDLWAETTVFAMPSRGEGFGLVYIEAMRWGIPVIASIHDAGNEVNANGVTGFNVNLDDPNELADRIVELLSNPEQARAMGAAGRERWRESFRSSAFRDRFIPIVRRLISR
jgi:phosphatidylinositol alpha-1,6-mannosyltransferase